MTGTHVGFGLLTLFPERVGGSETYVRHLLGEFARGNGPERVTVLANRHVERAYRDVARGPVGMRVVRSYRAGDTLATRALAMAGAAIAPRLAARDVPRDLDVLHYAVTVPIPRTELPTVVTVHDIQQLDRPEGLGRAQRLYRRWAYDDAVRSATRAITSSEYVRERLVGKLGMDRARIDVVPLGIDHDLFAPGDSKDDDAVLARLGLRGRYVVYPANLWPHKNHARLLDAFGAVADSDLRLVLAGQPYGRLKELTQRAAERGLDGRVLHLGFVSPGDMPSLYRRAQAMVFPSLYEGFGAPPLEAMACGCPVAVSQRASLPEVCGDAALMLDPENTGDIAAAIDRISSDTELRERLRARGFERTRSFSWSTAAEKHRAVYERASNEHSAG